MKEGKKTRASEAVKEFLIAARDAVVARLGEKKAKFVLLGILAALIALVLLVVAMLIIPVNAIEISGDTQMFNEGDIVEASGVGEGDRLFLHPFFMISGSIKKSLPLVDRVIVLKNPFNGRLYIDVKVKNVEFYTKVGDVYCAIDENLRVLDISTKRSKYSAFGAAFVKLPELREPVLGESLIFYDTVEETDTEGETLYEVKEERYYDYIPAFLKALRKSYFLSQTDGIMLEEKFDIRIVCDLKYQVKFGNSASLNAKLGALFEVFEEGSVVEYKDSVIIDVSQPSRPTARTDATLDFSEFDD